MLNIFDHVFRGHKNWYSDTYGPCVNYSNYWIISSLFWFIHMTYGHFHHVIMSKRFGYQCQLFVDMCLSIMFVYIWKRFETKMVEYALMKTFRLLFKKYFGMKNFHLPSAYSSIFFPKTFWPQVINIVVIRITFWPNYIFFFV